MRERVVVTGLGVVSPFNPDGDRERFWASLCAGETAVGAVRSFDASAYACRVAAEVDRRLLHDGAADPAFCMAERAFDRSLEHAGVDHLRLRVSRSAARGDGAGVEKEIDRRISRPHHHFDRTGHARYRR